MEKINQITISRSLFVGYLQTMVGHRRRTLNCHASICLGPEIRELIVARRAPPAGSVIMLIGTERFDREPPREIPCNVCAVMEVGLGPIEGRARGWIRDTGGRWAHVNRFNLPGPGMISVEIAKREDSIGSLIGAADSQRWSRTIGALGEGVYRRATSLRIGLIGLGRLNSLVAEHLVRFGVGQLVLVDPDKVESHNIGESALYSEEDVGRHKVLAAHAKLIREQHSLKVSSIAESVTHRASIEALKQCDILFSAPDQPGARLAAAAIASCFCRPLIDIGTRVHHAGPTTMGADIRLVTPERCLLCCGGLGALDVACQLLISPDAERAFALSRDWRVERRGSLRSLNQLAASVALRMFEDFIGNRITEPLWCHLEFEPTGRISIDYPGLELRARSAPCLCAIAGWADTGLVHVPQILASEDQ